jgi:predicted kinase
LHLANIVLWQGRPVLYDAIEFDEALATIDTLYDLAFLLMDLDVHGLRPAANVVLNHYLWLSGDDWDLQGLPALPALLALRAAVRARVMADRARQQPARVRSEAIADARRFLDAALRYLVPPAPELMAVGGFSGTGKSTLAAALAPWIGAAPGAVHLRSDLERKALAGVGEFERLPDNSYTPQARLHIYARLREKAKVILKAKHSVIVDAVFADASDRQQIEAIADALGVDFTGFWLEADPRRLVARVAARRQDASDATPQVVEAQLGTASKPSRRWRPLNADGSAKQTFDRASAAIGLKASATLR